MTKTIQVEFECVDLPSSSSGAFDHLRLGIQAGKLVEQDRPISAKTILLSFPLEILFPASASSPVFRGPFVQGPRNQPFIYLCWGERETENWRMIARAKIMLNDVPLDDLRDALEDQKTLRARISLTGLRGEPAAATLKEKQVEWLKP